jgi:putative endonuclease
MLCLYKRRFECHEPIEGHAPSLPLLKLQRMEPIYFFYILKCIDGSYYVGSAANLEDRVRRHNQGRGPSYTAKRLPVRLVYHERFNDLDDAVKRERQVKKWSRAKKEALINGKIEKLKELSKSH